MREWSNEYVPFNSNKAIYWMRYWESIRDGHIPPPPMVTVDPTNICNLNCVWCNSKFVVKNKSDNESVIRASMSKENIPFLCKYLNDWGVKAVWIAGGGEPTCYKHLGVLIDNLSEYGMEIGLTTNGLMLFPILSVTQIGKLKWLGVSVDAASWETFEKIKGRGRGPFNLILENMGIASEYTEVSYKFLISKLNHEEIFSAAKLAKYFGCRYFHARPVCIPWNTKDTEGNAYGNMTNDQMNIAINQLELARVILDSLDFTVVGATHKVNEDTWKPRHDFDRCWAIFMTCVIYPNGDIGLCCDRRGDEKIILGRWDKDNPPYKLWNTNKHREIQKKICFSECPRCTYAKHNRMFEEYVVKDSVCKLFY